MSQDRRLGRGLAGVSHLFLSHPVSEEKNAPVAESPHRNDFIPIFVTSGFTLLARSIVALNVAVDLGLRGIRMALVDADPGAPTARILAGGAVRSMDGGIHIPLGTGQTLPLLDSVADVPDETRYVIVNAPASVWLAGRTASGVRNLLLVASPSIQECIHGFAIAKRAAAVRGDLRLGIVVADVADDCGGRLLYERLVGVLCRRTSMVAAYCGWLSPSDRIGPSVRRRVPALLGSTEPDLSDRLRRITRVAAGLFDLEFWNRDVRTADSTGRRLGLTEEEMADLRRIVPLREPD